MFHNHAPGKVQAIALTGVSAPGSARPAWRPGSSS